MLEEHDKLSRRCPPLGGEVPFLYCRTVNMKLPCKRIEQCWSLKFEVSEWLEKNFTPEQLEKTFSSDEHSRIQKILKIAYEALKTEK